MKKDIKQARGERRNIEEKEKLRKIKIGRRGKRRNTEEREKLSEEKDIKGERETKRNIKEREKIKTKER